MSDLKGIAQFDLPSGSTKREVRDNFKQYYRQYGIVLYDNEFSDFNKKRPTVESLTQALQAHTEMAVVALVSDVSGLECPLEAYAIVDPTTWTFLTIGRRRNPRLVILTPLYKVEQYLKKS